MSKEKLPKRYLLIKAKHEKYMQAVEELGKTVKQEGPLDEKSILLIQLGAAATIRSEGSVHSHVRRLLELGVSPKEIYHAIIVLTCVIGYPAVAAALSWADDIIGMK